MIALDSIEIVDKDLINVSWFENGNHWETWDSNDLFNHIIGLNDEIERLNKKLKDLEKLNNVNYQSFIETNKIMIELEKWIKEILLSKAYSISYKEAYKDIYMKLQELKGSESNE